MSNFISRQVHSFLLILGKHSHQLDLNANSDIIKNELLFNKPTMIARFGSVEIKGILYPMFPFFMRLLFRNRVYKTMETNAGFFPVNNGSIKQFSKLMRNDMKLLDILGSWRIEEQFLVRYLCHSQRIPLQELEPYFQKNPWTEVLEGQKILVIHPFNKTIESQYINREKLFHDKYNYYLVLIVIRTKFTPACPFEFRVCFAFITVLIAMGIG